MKNRRLLSNESGVALITALLAVMLMSALMVGMFAALTTDQRSHAADRDQTQAYAAAQAGLEKLTSGLAQLFAQDPSPSINQINQVAAAPPTISNFHFVSPGGSAGSGYSIAWTPDANGNPVAEATTITTGPYTGFQGLITKYTATITASSDAGAEVRLRREIQTVAVPVFQFGMFSESDLSIFAGDNFSFGGRVHTNGSLFVCEQTGTGTMTFSDRMTALNEVVHNYFSNGVLNTTSNPSCTNQVLIPTSPTTTRNLKQSPNEGSVATMPGSAANPNWPTISTGTYRSYIRTGTTGAKRLSLPLTSQGAQPIDLIRRPAVNSNENIANPPVFGQRYFSMASLRILLSDRIADIANLPTVTAGAPVQLTGNWLAAPPAGYGPVDATHPPIARSIGPWTIQTNNASTYNAGTGLAQIYFPDATPLAGSAYALTQLTVTNVLGNTNVTCNGKTGTTNANLPAAPNNVANAFIYCNTPPGGLALPATVTGTVNGVPFTRNLTQAAVVNGPLVVGAAGGISNTAPYSMNTFWMRDTGGGTEIPVTCEGFADAVAGQRHFINCMGSGLTAAPGNNWALSTEQRQAQNESLIGGFIKIEMQDNAGAWSDVTTEILNLGIGAPNQDGAPCADPTPNAIVRIQRLRDNGSNAAACSYASSTKSWDWWPQTLYDPREGSFRSIPANSPLMMSGIIQYISLDANNLRRWFAGQIGVTGANANNQSGNGYIVYFSDRRGNHDINNNDVETAEFGFEDQVNPTTAAGAPDNVLQAGEDMNGNNNPERYGRTPSQVGGNIPNGRLAPYDETAAGSNAEVTMAQTNSGQGRVNKVVLFRRALKLVNGGIVGGVNSLPPGFTVASENPVYVEGNYNATTSALAEPNVPAAILADAITLLSNAWTDANSFANPNAWNQRNAATTGWRFAAVAGKGVSFPFCGAACGGPGDLFGTDGGASNFLRLLENWNNAGVSINYRGSLISLYNSRQAIGTYKFPQTHIYNGGVRSFTFDTDFLTPALLPPGTPMFRDVNTLKFRQILRPNQ